MHSCLRHRALKLKPHAAVLKNMMTAMATYPTFLPLASGLAAVHKKGLVHRDIKPPSAVYDTQHPTQAIARMNIFPRSDLFGSAGSVFIWSCIWISTRFHDLPSYAEGCRVLQYAPHF